MARRAIRFRPQRILLALTAVLMASPALAAPILVGTVSTLSDDSFLYSYELVNPAVEVENVFDLGLFFSGEPLDVVSPAGWESIAGLGFINWFSTTADSDVLAGQLLSGFSFRSVLGPGPVQYQTLGVNSTTGAIGEHVTGTSVGPAAAPIPEPGTLSLIGLGLAILARRRFTSPPTVR